MQINQALDIAQNILKNKGINSYRIDALLLLCYCLSLSKEQIIFNPNITLDSNQEKDFFELIKRRASKEPVSHLIGKREFFGIDFFVNNKVLDPRPDSESLIELALENFPDKNQNFRILELGVGSGCLVLTILKLFPNAVAEAVDVDKSTLETTKKNAALLNLNQRINFLESNWFENLDKNKKFDLIISNPPYIKTSDIDNLQEEVKNFEPIIALNGGRDGLDCYRAIAAQINNYLAKNGLVIVEIGQNQEDDVIRIFEKSGLNFVKEKKDLAGIVRCLMFKSN